MPVDSFALVEIFGEPSMNSVNFRDEVFQKYDEDVVWFAAHERRYIQALHDSVVLFAHQ